ncbi:MAG: ABC transporter permease [Desulfobulbaceae bacterium]|nr:ABC transporter permease [Desulfobulbaceae bacterium]
MRRLFDLLFGISGHFAMRFVCYLFDLAAFIVKALGGWCMRARLFDRRTYSPFVSQIIFTGVDALPAITLLGLITGFIITFRLIAIFDAVGGTENMITILTELIGLELGPLIAAIILVSRSGSAITVDIGNMKLRGEIEALELLGVCLDDLLITPRIVGTALSQLVLAVYFTIIALAGGVVISVILLSSNYFRYFGDLMASLYPMMVVAFLFKNLLFGLVIGAISCFHGLLVSRSPTELPQQTQRAIIHSLFFVFVLDGIVATVSL